MKVKFTADGHPVTVDDDNGVTCANKEILEWIQGQYDLHLDADDVSTSPAGSIGTSMVKAGYKVEFIESDTIH
jgi:hypothetical protein